MPTELFTRIDLDKLWPPYMRRLLELAAACRARGADYYAISGYRSAAEQMAIWQKGRNDQGAVVDPKSVVTTLRFGVHQLAGAVDFARDGNSAASGLQPSWNFTDYKVLAEECVKLDLESGYFWRTFKDPGHVQIPLEKYGLTIGGLKKVHDSKGLAGVFEVFSTAVPWS